MRRRISLLAGVLFACALCACSAQNVGDSGSQAASSAPVSSAPSENNLPESTAAPAVSDSQPSAPAESTAASSDIILMRLPLPTASPPKKRIPLRAMNLFVMFPMQTWTMRFMVARA